MKMPNVVHPTVFAAGPYRVQVVTYFALTDAQAALIAHQAFRQRKWLKKDRGTIAQVHWVGDQAALAVLEAAAERARSTLQDLLGGKAAPRRPRRP